MKGEKKMLKRYFLNKDTTKNPNGNNEVHCEGCVVLQRLSRDNVVDLGYHENGIDAVKCAFRKGFPNADGCKRCSPEAHRG